MSEVIDNVEHVVGETPKAFNYKGEIVDAASLTNAGVCAVELPEINVEAIKTDGWGSQPEKKLPKLLIVTAVNESPLGKKYCLLSYTPYLGKLQFQLRTVNVSNDFKVKRLNGAQAEKMLAAHRQVEFDSLHTSLGHNFHIGSDPEMFVTDGDDKLIPAFSFLGAKSEKKTMTRKKNNVYFDGAQAEFETTAGGCLAFHVDSIQEGLDTLYKAARKHDKTAKLSLKNVMEIEYDVLNTAKDEHLAFGCAPSENVYGLKGKQVPPRELPFRSSGGHIHFGIGHKEPEQIKQMVRALDAILGVCCVSLFAKYDNPIRRQFYGMAGEYRTPKHGLEYRALSNAWVCHPMISHMVMDLARKCVVFGEKGFLKFWETTEAEVIECMQNCDVDLAHKIMERNHKTLLKIFRAAYSYLSEAQLESAYHIFYDGCQTAIKTPEDIVGNWRLEGNWVTHSGAAGATCSVGMDTVNSGSKV